MWKESYILLEARQMRAFGELDPRFMDHDARHSSGCASPEFSYDNMQPATEYGNHGQRSSACFARPSGRLEPDPNTGFLRFVD